jgi:hypothetical protein
MNKALKRSFQSVASYRTIPLSQLCVTLVCAVLSLLNNSYQHFSLHQLSSSIVFVLLSSLAAGPSSFRCKNRQIKSSSLRRRILRAGYIERKQLLSVSLNGIRAICVVRVNVSLITSTGNHAKSGRVVSPLGSLSGTRRGVLVTCWESPSNSNMGSVPVTDVFAVPDVVPDVGSGSEPVANEN